MDERDDPKPDLSAFLSDPAAVAKRIRSMAERKFISDVLRYGHFTDRPSPGGETP